LGWDWLAVLIQWNPVIGGLAIGVGLIVIFLILEGQSFANPEQGLVWVSYEPKRCIERIWESDLLKEHPDFYRKAEAEQSMLLAQHFERMNISILDVQFRTTNSPPCEGCGCTRGQYLIDFQVINRDAERLKEILEPRSMTLG
jgi:hypothetical protein